MASRRDLAQFALVKRTHRTTERSSRYGTTGIAVDDSAFLIGRALVVAGHAARVSRCWELR